MSSPDDLVPSQNAKYYLNIYHAHSNIENDKTKQFCCFQLSFGEIDQLFPNVTNNFLNELRFTHHYETIMKWNSYENIYIFLRELFTVF